MSKREWDWEWDWECRTCGSREPASATQCRTCRNPKGSPKAPFELSVYGDFSFLYPGMDSGPDQSSVVTLNEDQLDKGIIAGIYTEGCFNGFRCNSTWGPFISLWPERYQALKTDGYTEPNSGFNEDY